MNQNPNFLPFTVEYNGRANRLITEIKASQVYDFTNPPKNIPPMFNTNGLWDTGASHSFINQSLVKKLGLVSVGSEIISHAGGSNSADNYMINLFLPNLVALPGVMVSECTLPANFEVLIGMDVISQGDFALTNVGGKTLFSFRLPSLASIDYVAEKNQLLRSKMRPNDPCFCNSGRKFKKCHGGTV